LCSIDLYKAFDKVNHHGLYLKLMKSPYQSNFFWFLKIGSLAAVLALSGMRHDQLYIYCELWCIKTMVQSYHHSSIFIWMISLESTTVLNGNLLLYMLMTLS